MGVSFIFKSKEKKSFDIYGVDQKYFGLVELSIYEQPQLLFNYVAFSKNINKYF